MESADDRVEKAYILLIGCCVLITEKSLLAPGGDLVGRTH